MRATVSKQSCPHGFQYERIWACITIYYTIHMQTIYKVKSEHDTRLMTHSFRLEFFGCAHCVRNSKSHHNGTCKFFFRVRMFASVCVWHCMCDMSWHGVTRLSHLRLPNIYNTHTSVFNCENDDSRWRWCQPTHFNAHTVAKLSKCLYWKCHAVTLQINYHYYG